MAKIITDEDVRYYLKNPAVTEYMVLRDKLQDLENAREIIDQLKTELGNYIDKYFLESQKVVNLSKVLTKIKEICNNNDELKGDFSLVDCDKYKLGKHNLANRILQKISECEGNDEH